MTRPGKHAKKGRILTIDIIAGIFIGSISIIVTIVPEIVGATHISLLWKLLLTVNVAALAALITHAIQVPEARTKVLSAAIVVALMLSAGAYSYHSFLDPSLQNFQLVMKGNETQKFYMSGDAGGPPEKSHGVPILWGGITHTFVCVRRVPRKGRWARLADQKPEPGWVKLAQLHPPAGTPWPYMPTC